MIGYATVSDFEKFPLANKPNPNVIQAVRAILASPSSFFSSFFSIFFTPFN